MLFKKHDITYSDIIQNDFVFTKIEVPMDFINYVQNLKYAGQEDPSEDVRYKIMHVDETTDLKIKDLLLSTLSVDENIKKDILGFQFGIDKYTKGDGLPLHTDKGRINPYEVLLYLPEDDIFIGRDLHVVSPDYNVKIKPIVGLVCFINAFAEATYHGVTELETDSSVYVVIGGLGINSREWRDGINIMQKKLYDQSC